jgi:DNA invertase Pin-like site-specific DNA recombinase
MQPTAPRPKAYSYIRFSTPEQAAGDSLRRQTEAARGYAKLHGLDLDETLTFKDLGVSAFQGRNAAVGALGLFVDAVREGRVERGSYLLVESLDRISRQTVLRAVHALERIVIEDINLVDLSDGGKLYNTHTLDTDTTAFLLMSLRFMRANEESKRKSERVGSAYAQKRSDAKQGVKGKPFTKMLPAWLRWDDTRREFVLSPERAEVVRRMFRDAAAGIGQHQIAHKLNARGAEPWGKGKRKGKHWHRSYVQKILTNPAVIGTFTPHRSLKDATGKRIREPQEPIENYWPAVVDAELFHRVVARVGATAARGRNAGAAPASIFSGVLKCSHCGGTVTRIAKGGKAAYLVCSRAHARGACKRQAVRYEDAEGALRDNADALIDDAPTGQETTELDRQIVGWDEWVSILSDEARTLVAEIVRDGQSASLRLALREKERDLAQARGALWELQTRREALTSAYVLRRLSGLRKALKNPRWDVAAVNGALKEAVTKIVRTRKPDASVFTGATMRAPPGTFRSSRATLGPLTSRTTTRGFRGDQPCEHCEAGSIATPLRSGRRWPRRSGPSFSRRRIKTRHSSNCFHGTSTAA